MPAGDGPMDAGRFGEGVDSRTSPEQELQQRELRPVGSGEESREPQLRPLPDRSLSGRHPNGPTALETYETIERIIRLIKLYTLRPSPPRSATEGTLPLDSETKDPGPQRTTESGPLRFTSRLIDRREVAERTIAFRFARPTGFRFTAGQFAEMTLQSPKETDDEGDTRAFSIASPPGEESLTVATRMRDTAFKRTLASMAPGTPVTLAGGFGDLVLHEDSSRPAVLLTGGIGITPFRSIVLDAARRGLRRQISLFYSNRRPEDAAFLDELREFARTHPAFRLIATMTQMEQSERPWHGETGPIDWAMLVRHAAAAGSMIYYVAGPPRMVKGLQAMLRGAGIPPERVRAEEFDGY